MSTLCFVIAAILFALTGVHGAWHVDGETWGLMFTAGGLALPGLISRFGG